MSFRLTEDALLVDNDGRFTDCDHVRESECAWRTSKGHRCDFHRFRLVASGDKREQADTIGAFGIGFIAVYQITDRPELITGGRHWILHEDRREDERIAVCPGCSACKAPALPGTRFILPWARDPQSVLRSKLRAEIPQPDAPVTLAETLHRCVPTAMLFLTRLTSIDIIHDGDSSTHFDRRINGERIHISDGVHDYAWHLLQGGFSATANGLKQLHAGKIESKRSDVITLALPTSALDTGVFCAFLPTEHETGLPFHVNADFFTTSDRKRIVLEADYQSDFNRAAIQAAADTLGRNLTRLPTFLGPERFWTLVDHAHRAAQEAKAGRRDASLGEFWGRLAPQLPHTPVLYTTQGAWRRPAEVRLLEREEEEPATSVIEELGIPLVHPCLRPFHNLLRQRDVTAVQYLDIPDIIDTLLRSGLTGRRSSSDMPPSLVPPEHREALLSELTVLLRRRRTADMQQRMEAALATCALAPARDDTFWPFCEVYRADDTTIALFARILPTIPFLADHWRQAEPFTILCPAFSAIAAIEALETLDVAALTSANERGDLDPAHLLEWFESRRAEVLRSAETRHQLATLPIFPGATGLRPLAELALPGDFDDPLRVANLIDLRRLGDRRDFLRDLGADSLTFVSYARTYLPQALRTTEHPRDIVTQAVHLLSSRLGEIRDDSSIRDALADTPLVLCEDGHPRKPAEVYLPNSIVRELLVS